MRRSSCEPADNAPAPVVGEGPDKAARREPEARAADDEDVVEDARRARWVATVTGVLLAVMGVTASSMRLSGVPGLVPAAYGSGAVVCVLASVLGARGRTRVALWLMILGTMVMALGDQFD